MKKSGKKSVKKKAVVRPNLRTVDKILTDLARQSKVESVRMSRLHTSLVELRTSLVEVRKAAEALAKQAEVDRDKAVVDRDRLAKLENATDTSRKEHKNHTARLARMLENAFAASLPRVMEDAHGIVIRPKDIRVRARKSNHSAEFDFVAPNGELVLAGEVKTHLTLREVREFHSSLLTDFRGMFPEYAGMPVYGVVAGGEIDEDAAHYARKLGFYILRLEGAELHPQTGRKYRAKAY